MDSRWERPDDGDQFMDFADAGREDLDIAPPADPIKDVEVYLTFWHRQLWSNGILTPLYVCGIIDPYTGELKKEINSNPDLYHLATDVVTSFVNLDNKIFLSNKSPSHFAIAGGPNGQVSYDKDLGKYDFDDIWDIVINVYEEKNKTNTETGGT